ncbi:FUSC family protein [Streptomyces sp. NBC_01176]|uniref:FUSC family protein n=1 Tax=Streptomyces sp. NBC_01176 TaxID=2903760 RepID=UPI003866F68C|nr:aromatic acid exporter family protein [Streptomyces sp. NBC_01176]
MQDSIVLPGYPLAKRARSARHLTDRLRGKRSSQAVYGVKTLAATMLTWGAVAPWSPGGHPYLAVTTALLAVNASTVYRSVTQAAQNMVARVAGLVLAVVTARLLGPTAGGVVAIVVVAVLAGPRRSTDDRVQIASTALIALAASAADPVGSLVSPVLQTLVGAAVGVAVNALVLPPLYLDESDAAVRGLAHDMGTLLRDMGSGLAQRHLTVKAHTWLHQARHLEERFTSAQEDVQRADESLRWNTRCVAHARCEDLTYAEAYGALRGVSLQVRGIARTLADNAHNDHADHHLGQQFLDRYAETLRLAGDAVQGFAGPRAATGPSEAAPRGQLREAIDEAQAWHDAMTDLIGGGTLVKPGAWYVYGSLMTDVERLLADLDHVGAH